MRYFARFNPFRAINDFRRFLALRNTHELWIGFASVMLTVGILAALQLDSRVPPPPYEPKITYVESWPATRSDAEIVARQKIDQAAKEKREAELAAWRENRKAQFKRLDDQLTGMGL